MPTPQLQACPTPAKPPIKHQSTKQGPEYGLFPEDALDRLKESQRQLLVKQVRALAK